MHWASHGYVPLPRPTGITGRHESPRMLTPRQSPLSGALDTRHGRLAATAAGDADDPVPSVKRLSDTPSPDGPFESLAPARKVLEHRQQQHGYLPPCRMDTSSQAKPPSSLGFWVSSARCVMTKRTHPAGVTGGGGGGKCKVPPMPSQAHRSTTERPYKTPRPRQPESRANQRPGCVSWPWITRARGLGPCHPKQGAVPQEWETRWKTYANPHCLAWSSCQRCPPLGGTEHSLE